MKLENGYKVLYATPVKDEATGKVVEFTVSASNTGLFNDADPILTVAKDSFKLIYEKDGKIYGSVNTIPTVENGVIKDTDLSEAGLNKVFEVSAEEDTTTESTEQPKQDEVENTPDEGQDNGQEDEGQEDEGQDGDDEQVVPSDEE